jgi:HEAT repeat protein
MCVHPARTIGGDAAMDNVASALNDPDEHVRYAACWQFAHHNDRRAVGKIRILLDDPFPMVRSGAATVLIRLRLIDKYVMDVLVNDDSWDVRREVANELIKAGIADQRIVETIKQLMEEPEAAEYEERISDYLAYKESDEYKATAIDLDDEELSEEDKAMFREWEDHARLTRQPHSYIRNSLRTATYNGRARIRAFAGQ